RHIGAETDVPAGDIGVGERETGYLIGQYKRMRNNSTGVMTGKGPAWGARFTPPAATGYGLLYFVERMLYENGDTLKGKTVAISGAGNVAQYAALKATALGAKVISISNSTGTIHDENGFNAEKLDYLKSLDRELATYTEKYPSEFLPGKKPWHLKCDIAFPCATQNELDAEDAKTLLANGCHCIAEGANMPSTDEAIKVIMKSEILYAPGKATNAGGVAVSGLELSQNRLGQQWTAEKVDSKLKTIMQ